MNPLEDLQYFLALARNGSLSAAGTDLQVSHTTVSRHVRTLEKYVGYRLFDKGPAGWNLTDEGLRLLERAERIEHEALAAFAGRDNTAGTVRVATTEGFGTHILAPLSAQIRRADPSIEIELMMTSRTPSVSARDFDIAITLQPPMNPNIDTVRLTPYRLGLFASIPYLDRHGTPPDLDSLRAHDFVWYVQSLLDMSELDFRELGIPDEQKVVRCTTSLGQLAAVRAGAGVGVLPLFMVGQAGDLRPVLSASVMVERTYWLVTSPHSSRRANVRVVASAIVHHVSASNKRFLTCDVAPSRPTAERASSPPLRHPFRLSE
ncbi:MULTISPECIES: LysR family transcriptional regulator [unclassified Nocardioides]|uniref:LysR family transcriptional regulator n=1 Tax=unclassified Nocardioides TaxID=2615069 RepID=UPI0000571253|nr:MULTISPECIES: LysR family transcriptional regulator [unclassified Nocardioides]ABL81661.1 transcriptional regulator, LysR family [Nocardioides sp. JS614]